MEAKKQARSLIDQFGLEGALDHVDYVLDPSFGLSQLWQINFWHQVRIHVKEAMAPHFQPQQNPKTLQK